MRQKNNITNYLLPVEFSHRQSMNSLDNHCHDVVFLFVQAKAKRLKLSNPILDLISRIKNTGQSTRSTTLFDTLTRNLLKVVELTIGLATAVNIASE